MQVVAKIEGELFGANDVADLTTKKLLIPSTRVYTRDQPTPEQVQPVLETIIRHICFVWFTFANLQFF